jgi:acetate kinase
VTRVPGPNVLVVNCGSSSLKFALVEPVSGEVMRRGLVERLSGKGAHARALDQVLEKLEGQAISAVGHRVVHGGEYFTESVLLDSDAIAKIAACSELAPLHNPANLSGIEAARERFPDVPHVAVFDTAFHQSLPPKAFMYAIPFELYEKHKVRRYGFHGSSHRYVATETARLLGKPLERLDLITAHLGNGCSACAIHAGRSVDTTMGLTPLEGLVMGTRSGDVDPNLHDFLVERAGLSLTEVTDLLNRKSGLLGLSGSSNDMRTLLEARAHGDSRASLAIGVFTYRLSKAILGLAAALERVDALVFTGGIGEYAQAIRAETLDGLRVLGPVLDPALNAKHGASSGGRITGADSRLLALVVPTNEELVIAREATRLAASPLGVDD